MLEKELVNLLYHLKSKITNKKNYESITSASLELDISFSIISKICRKVNYYKTVISKKDGDRYSFEFLEKNT